MPTDQTANIVPGYHHILVEPELRIELCRFDAATTGITNADTFTSSLNRPMKAIASFVSNSGNVQTYPVMSVDSTGATKTVTFVGGFTGVSALVNVMVLGY